MTLGPDSFTDLWRASTRGLTGGDAALSTQLPDGRVLWVFGDSFIDRLKPDGTRPLDTPVARNAFVIQSRDCLTTLFRGTHRHPSAYLGTGEDPYLGWYWPNQPFVSHGQVVVPLTHMQRTGPGGWAFEPTGTAIATLRLPSLELIRIRRIAVAPGTYWGITAIRTARRTYVFGADERRPGLRGLLVARARRGLAAGHWSFWTGARWSPDPGEAAPVAELPSSQFSVVKRSDRFVLVAKEGMDPPVLTLTARSPTGPWTTGPLAAWIQPLPEVVTYNVALHPEFAAGDRTLLSYSVNCASATLEEVHLQPWHYLPRFTSVLIPRRAP